MNNLNYIGQFLVQLVILTYVAANKVRNVYWNTTTSSFSDKPLIVTVNEGNLPWEYDQVNLICPVMRNGHSGEQHVIYSVEREEFDNCRVTSPRPRIVAVCNRPETFMYFTITFRSFTPTPGGLEFKPGKEYYFISTANSRDLHRRVGGWCQSHNMKMIVKVAESKAEQAHKQNKINSQRISTLSPIPSPAAYWYRSHRQRSRDQVNQYHQSESQTYFSEYKYKDKSVDIRIDAESYKSKASSLSSFFSLLLLSTLLLLRDWKL